MFSENMLDYISAKLWALILLLLVSEHIQITIAWRKLTPDYTHFVGRQLHRKEKLAKGISKIQPRIYGGRPARFGETPYYLRLMKYDHFACGASLLNYRGLKFALTAAHCIWEGEVNLTHITVSTTPVDRIQLVGADLDLEAYSKREQWFDVVKLIIHPNYDPRWYSFDVALMFLDRYAFESLGLEHVPLPQFEWDPPDFVTIVGHGAKLRYDVQRELQLIETKVVPRDICQTIVDTWGDEQLVLKSEFCIGHPESWTLRGICFGDSGGPVVGYNYTLQFWYLAGLVSYTQTANCPRPGTVSVMQLVSEYVPWITEHAAEYLKIHGTGNPYTNGTPEDF